MICKINNKVSETTSFFYMSCGHGVIPVVIKKQKINVLIYNFYYGHNEPIVNIITKSKCITRLLLTILIDKPHYFFISCKGTIWVLCHKIGQ